MRVGKTGLNPSIPLCPYCGEAKNEIILTGLSGEVWAKKNGYSDMPKYIYVENDIIPCDECKKKGIAVVEVFSDYEKTPTGNKWLVTEEFVREIMKDQMLGSVLNERIFMIPVDVAKALGFHQS